MTVMAPLAPVRLRVYAGDLIGHTSFFRNRPLLETSLDWLRQRFGDRPLKILFQSCSIGAEPYSFAIAAALRGCTRWEFEAVDRSPEFLQMAREAVYPARILDSLAPNERAYFTRRDDQTVRVAEEIRERVRFLPPSSFVDFEGRCVYQAVFLLNALLYVPSQDQTRALQAISRCHDGLLAITAFHANQLQADLSPLGYGPVLQDMERIYEAWDDRRALPEGFMVEGVTHASPALPPFSRNAGDEWRCGTLFAKHSAESAGPLAFPVESCR